MLLEVLATAFKAVRTSDYTTNGYPSRGATLSEPTGDGVIQLAQGGAFCQNSIYIVPFGAGTATNTFGMIALGWRRDNSNPPAWYPIMQGSWTCTLSTMTGVGGGIIDGSHLICDTLALVTGSAQPNVNAETVSPGGNVAAHILLATEGCQKMELIFSTGGSATGCNAVIALL